MKKKYGKKVNPNVVDLGEWSFPKSWDEVTLGMVQSLDATDSLVGIIAALSGRSEKDVSLVPLPFVESMVSELSFLKDKPEVVPNCSCEIGGEVYTVNVTEQMRLGEFVAVETILKADPSDAAGVLAAVCRKPGEVYDTAFENEVFQSRKEMFLNAPCTSVLPVAAFFLIQWELSENSSRRYSQMKEAAQSLIQENISLLRSDGVGVGYFSRRSAIRKLKRLSRHINSIY